MIAPTEELLDVLRELVNIASGNAATALAMMVGQRTMIEVPRVTLTPVDCVAAILGTGTRMVAVPMRIEGDITGVFLFVIPTDRAHELSALLLGLPAPGAGEFDEAQRSALQETANVLAGAYTGSLAEMIDGVVMISTPGFAVEPPDDVLERYREDAAGMTPALCIETSIVIGPHGTPCGAHLVLLPFGGGLLETIERLEIA